MIIGTPVGHNALIHLGFVKSLMRVPEYRHVFQESCSIPLNRNLIVERAKFMQDDLLFIDSDMVFRPEDVSIMQDRLKTYDIVTGVAVMAFPGWPAAVFGDDLKPIEVKGSELFEIKACGAAFLGISKRVLPDIFNPFDPIGEHGEDISFCLRAKSMGYKIWCDPLLKIGHIKQEVKYYGIS